MTLMKAFTIIIVIFSLHGIVTAQSMTTGGSCSGTQCVVTGTTGGISISGISPIVFATPSIGQGGSSALEITILDETGNFCPVSTESSKDALARAFALAIQGLDSTIEHGAILVSGPNGVELLEIVSGTPTNLPQGRVLATVANSGYNFENVVGFIHYHPPSTAPTEQSRLANDARNRAPYASDFDFVGSTTASGSLRSLADHSLNTVELAQWINNFSQYIVGPDGIAREFDGINPHDSVSDNNFDDVEATKTEEDANSICN